MGHRPKIGERRSVRRRLKIDSLPAAVGVKIQKLRAEGKTWPEIEALSKDFAGERLPHSTLQRWYDLRVDQARKEIMQRAESARAIAEAFASRGFKGLPDAVKNALGDLVFTLTEASDEKTLSRARKELADLGWLLAQHRRLDIQQQRADAESKRIGLLERDAEERRRKFDKATNEAAAKIGKGKGLSIQDIDRIRERVFGLDPVASGHPA